MSRAPDLTKLTKNDLKLLIEKNSETSRVSFNVNERGKSVVWTSFDVVFVDGKAAGFVRSVKCSSILSWDTKNGTHSLLNHVQSCERQHQIVRRVSTSSSVIVSDVPRKPISDLAKDDINQTVVIGLAQDLRPLYSVESKGFLRIVQAFSDFGARHGHVDVKNILQHRKTLKDKHLNSVVSHLKGNIMTSLQGSLSYPRFSFTTDMWTDQYKQRHFLSLSIHFIDHTFTLKNSLLAVEEFPDEKKSTINIRGECTRILQSYFPSDDASTIMDHSTAVTDGGSNMVGVFPRRLPCQCHVLNLVLELSFKDKALTEHFPAIKSSIDGVKALVTCFKKAGLNSKLPYTLKQDVTTRWNSKLIMLESYQKLSLPVKEILLKMHQLHRITGIDDDLVTELVTMLRHFRTCSEKLSADKCPTINIVVICYEVLRDELSPKADDSRMFANFKTSVQGWFDKYCQSDPIYYAACMLHPKYKKLQFTSEEIREAAKKLLRNWMDIVTPTSDITERLTSMAKQDEGPPSKMPRTFLEKFEDHEDEDEDEDELTIYIGHSLPRSDVAEFDLLEFWKKSLQFPTLRKVASWVLAIPASEATEERTFSSTGTILSPRRTELHSATMSDMTFVHNNYHNYYIDQNK